MLRIQQRLLSFSIVSHKIAHNVRDSKRDPTLNFYPVVGLTDTKLGTISLNQPNNQNFLTTEMMGEIFRFLNTYHHDHSVENVWIQNKGSMFLGGLSYQELIGNPEYLDKLYKMTVMVAKLNKPIFALVKGGVRNVGAYVLSMASVALTDYSATLRIDEASKGFVPVAGGSHRLSRLPLNVGYYLALTGKRLDSTEMSRLGLITAIAKQGVSSKQMRSHITKSNLFFRDRVRVNTFDRTPQEFEEWNKILVKKRNLKHEIEINQMDIVESQQNVYAKFAMNQFKIAQFNHENAKKPLNSFSQKPGRHINNYFRMRHEKAANVLLKEGLIEKSEFEDLRLPGFEVDQILRVFERDSIAEVVKALEADQSEWAIDTLKHLRQMDPLAATLTFELIKRAEDLSWDQCLDLEYTVAKRLLANSKLALQQTYAGSKHVLVNQYSQGRIEDIPLQAVLEEYFSTALNEDQQLQRQLPLHSLLPNNDYKFIPDSARLAMNQQYFDDIHLANQEREMKRWLEANKIDYRHKSYNIHSLREKIHNKQECELIKQNESKRLEFIINNSKVMRQFVDERFGFIDQMSDEELQNFIEANVKSTVNNGIQTRFDEFQKTAAIIGKEKKLEIFKNLRKLLVKKIVIDGLKVEERNIEANEAFKGIIYFSQNNKGIFETSNPNLEAHQPLKKLAEEFSQKGQITEEFSENEGALPKDRHLGLDNSITKRQNYLKRMNELVAKRYQEYPHEWTKAFEYQELVREAAKTSEDLAQYLDWDTSSFYNTLLNAPATETTYADLGREYLEKFEAERNVYKSAIRTQNVLSQTFSQEFFNQIYQSTQPTNYKPSNFIKEEIIPKFAITKQLQKFIAPLLQQILKTFEEKYYKEALQDKKLEFGEFDRIIYESQDKEFVEYYKNDILFVYSYFAILKVKDVLHNLKLSGIQEKPEDYMAFFRQYNIEFFSDRTPETMSKVLSKFLFNMLDLHTYTKPKIRLPQTKLLDFLNRTKISRETQKKSLYPLSFESLLLMIGKDRSRVYNKILAEFLPTEPQYLLDMARSNTKDQMNDQNASKGSHAPTLYTLENTVSNQHLEKKRLISGYQYYLGLFDSFIHRASGKYNFINDEILSNDPKALKAQMSNIINLKETPKEWFGRATELAIRNFFNSRVEFEKSLTKGELLAFDQELKELISPDTFRLVLKFLLQSEIQQTKAYFTKVRHYEYPTTQSDKQEEMYCEIRRNVKNPEAFKRLNNLKMAMNVHKDYFMDNRKKITGSEEQQDLVEEKREFSNYERFPKQTYRRLSNELYEYGEEKNFDRYLNPINEREIEPKNLKGRLHFIDDERQTRTKKEQKFTDFDDEIKLLRNTLNKNNNTEEIDSVYKKLEELL